jgi:hypothetical protein
MDLERENHILGVFLLLTMMENKLEFNKEMSLAFQLCKSI